MTNDDSAALRPRPGAPAAPSREDRPSGRPPESASEGPAELLQGGGDMGALARATDWAGTPIGPVAAWPQSLRTSVSICLASRFPLLLWWGPEFVMIYNDAYRPILGAKHPRAMGQAGAACWAEIWDIIGPMLRGVLAEGRATWSEDQMLPMDRHGYTEETFFTFTYSPIRDESGGVGGVFCAVIETTERVIEERRLRLLGSLASEGRAAKAPAEACARAAAAIAASPADVPFALLYLLDEGGATATLAGAAGAERGAPFAPAAVALDGPSPWPFARVAEAGEAVVLDPADGAAGALPGGAWPEPARAAVVAPIARPGHDRPYGFVVAGVSPRRALDAGYRRFLDLLAAGVTQAVAAAAAYDEEQKRAAALAALDRAKTDFFSNVSHEFRTPLTLLLGPLGDALAGGPLDETRRPQLELAHRSSTRLLKLVNALLDFSRVEAGRARAAFAPTDLTALTADLASVFRAAFDKAGVALVVDAAPLGEPVYVDRDLWEKIVLNLLSNAFKHTFEGEVAVGLRLEGGDAVLEVRDTGVGISESELPHLFERFHRVRGARSRTHEGTGIGLSLVRELVGLHGGTIAVTSREGEGTTFAVRVPRGAAHVPPDRLATPAGAPPAPASAPPAAAAYVEEALRWLPNSAAPGGPPEPATEPPRAAPAAAPTGAAPSTSERAAGAPAAAGRVLLADDNADMRAYVAGLLGRAWDVTAVGDGAAALAHALAAPPDLVLADVMMPGLDGFALLRALREHPRTSTVPVVLLSARAGEEAKVEGLGAGADDYLVKPFVARELEARVRANVDLARLRRRAAARDEQLRLLTAAVPQFVWLATPAGGRAYQNDRWYAYAGLGPETSNGDGWRAALHPDDDAPYEAAWARALAEARAFEFEYRLRSAGGAYRWHLCRAEPRLGEGGAVVEWVGTCTDVDHARRERDRVTEVLESTQDAFFALDRDYRIVLVNRNQEKVSGVPREQLLGRNFYDAFPAARDPGSKYWTEYHRVVERGEAVEFEEYYAPLDLWTEVRASRTADGGVAVFFRDVSARKRLEGERARGAERLALSEGRYRSFVEATAQLVWVTDPAGGVEEDSHSWRAFTGQTYEGWRGRGWLDAVHPEDAPRAREAWDDAVRAGGTYEVEYRLRRHDGTYRAMSARGAPVRDGAGRVREWVGVNVDVTERRAAEDERARLLERAQQARAEAEVARAEAERANHMKDEFLATVSHELRTPLNAMLGWATMLQNDGLDAPTRARAVETIERNARAQARLIEDLLDLSRILQGKFVLAVGPVEAVRVVEAALDAVRPAAHAKGIRLQPVLDSHATIVGDAERLQQVAWNLLSNAIKFTPKGGRVQVTLRRAPSYVELSVADNGEGIDPAFLPHVFDKFRQADGSTTRRAGGVGLGLSIVRSLVELHGGTVTAASDGPGRGATFVARLPMAPLRAETARPPRPDAAAEPRRALFECPPALAGLRVLVVDDEKDTRELLAFVLGQCDAAVTTAESGAEAFAALERERFDVLVSDVGMPGEDGLSLVGRIRKLPAARGGRIPALALTAYARGEDRANALRAGFNMHLAKPIEPTELLLVVAGLVGARP